MAIFEVRSVDADRGTLLMGRSRFGRGMDHDGRSRTYSFADAEAAAAVRPGDTLVIDQERCDRCNGMGTEPPDPMKVYCCAPPCRGCGGSGGFYSVGIVTVAMAAGPATPTHRLLSTRRPTMEETWPVEDLFGRRGFSFGPDISCT